MDPTLTAALLLIAALIVAALVLSARRLMILRRLPALPGVAVDTPVDDTTVDEEGVCRSLQTATLTMPAERADRLFTAEMLERLARTYWAYMTTLTLGVVRIFYRPDERSMSLLVRPVKLLRFAAPEYALDERRGYVRWRIVGGLLLARRGREEGHGYLSIAIERLEAAASGEARVHIEVVVESFHPLVHRISPWLYTNTQSRFHVLLAYGFLDRLVRRDLDLSVTGRFAERAPATDEPR